MKRRVLTQASLFAVASALLLAWACGAPQVPPGPEPEYQRPTVMPWDAGVPEDPFAAIEAEGEWVDEEPDAGATTEGATSPPANSAIPPAGSGEPSTVEASPASSAVPPAGSAMPPAGSAMPPPNAAPPASTSPGVRTVDPAK